MNNCLLIFLVVMLIFITYRTTFRNYNKSEKKQTIKESDEKITKEDESEIIRILSSFINNSIFNNTLIYEIKLLYEHFDTEKNYIEKKLVNYRFNDVEELILKQIEDIPFEEYIQIRNDLKTLSRLFDIKFDHSYEDYDDDDHYY